jgi:hypothetical protein
MVQEIISFLAGKKSSSFYDMESSTENSSLCLDIIKPGRKIALDTNLDSFTSSIGSGSRGELVVETVSDGVFIIDDVLDENECKLLCEALDMNSSLSFWSPLGRSNDGARMFRNADTLEVNSKDIANRIWERLESCDLKSFLKINVSEEADDINWERELLGQWLPSSLNHDLLFAKYPSYGAFAPHTDGRAIHSFNVRSFYSVILFLNSIPLQSGGGTRFYTSDAAQQLSKCTNAEGKEYWTSDPSLTTAEVEAVAGRMLIFHQALVHEGVPPIAPHEKYIIRSDVMLERNPRVCDSEQDVAAYKLFQQAEDLAEEGKVDESIPLFKKAFKLSPEMARIMGQA